MFTPIECYVQGYLSGLQIHGISNETCPAPRRSKHLRSQCIGYIRYIRVRPHCVFASIMDEKPYIIVVRHQIVQ
jgi:hypothetical protein